MKLKSFMVLLYLLRGFALIRTLFPIGKILNIYSRVNIAASDQQFGYGSIWKPVDGLHSPAIESSWDH